MEIYRNWLEARSDEQERLQQDLTLLDARLKKLIPGLGPIVNGDLGDSLTDRNAELAVDLFIKNVLGLPRGVEALYQDFPTVNALIKIELGKRGIVDDAQKPGDGRTLGELFSGPIGNIPFDNGKTLVELVGGPIASMIVMQRPAGAGPDQSSDDLVDRASIRSKWLDQKLGGRYSINELACPGKIAYNTITDWCDGKTTNQTDRTRRKLADRLSELGIKTEFSEVPE